MVSDIPCADVKVVRKLVLHRQVPLLSPRKVIGVEGTVIGRVLAVKVRGIDEGWRCKVLREPVLEEKGGLKSAEGAAE